MFHIFIFVLFCRLGTQSQYVCSLLDRFDTMNHDSGADVKIRTEVPAGVLESPEKEEQDT